MPEKTETTKQLKPPYGNVAWYKKFFELIRSRSFDTFNKEIIELNIIKGSNSKMFFNGLRFLSLVEEDGKVTEKFESLRRIGEEFRQNLQKVVEEAYSDLFTKVVVDKAKPEYLFNYLLECYGYGGSTAKLAVNIFIYLCQEAEIPISPELKAPKVESKRERRRIERRVTPKGRRRVAMETPEGMHEIKWAKDLLIYLRMGDRKTREKVARKAKRLIDIYVEEVEEEQATE